MKHLLVFLACVGILSAETEKPGSVIVLSVSGIASAYMPSGKQFSGNIERGNVLSEGLTVKTSQFTEVLLLFFQWNYGHS